MATQIDAAARQHVVEELGSLLIRHYVFPDMAADMAGTLSSRLTQGAYDQLSDDAALAKFLTDDLQAICKDKHLRVRFNATELAMREDRRPTPAEEAEWEQALLLNNGAFHKVERLAGNVGYIEFRNFESPAIVGDIAVAAMQFVANTGALIIDLRRNGGGEPDMIQLITSYLFGERDRAHLNSMYWREGDQTEQFWTLPYVPGKRFGREKPVYVLTSSRTFSGAEEFSYNLKNLKRATLVGEVTGGGAHPGGWVRITPHFEAFIPLGRAISPVTGTNWEGTGVAPDIAVPAEQAFTVAYREALQQVIRGAGESPAAPLRALRDEAQTALDRLENER